MRIGWITPRVARKRVRNPGPAGDWLNKVTAITTLLQQWMELVRTEGPTSELTCSFTPEETMNTLHKYLLAALVAASIDLPHAFAQDSTLALYLPCNGSAEDASLYGNDGIVLGAVPVADRSGRPDAAYWFDGDSSKIVIPNSPSIHPTDQLTIAFWAYLDGMTDNYLDVFVKGGPVTGYFENREYAVYLKDNFGNAYFQLLSAGDGQGQHETWSNTYTPRQWLFFTGIVDRKNHSMRVYINGAEQSLYSIADSYSSFNVNAFDLWIGAGEEGLPEHRPFKGVLDDIRLYRRALSDQEILDLFLAPQDSLPHASVSHLRDFGHILVGKSASQVLTFRNRGVGTLVVSQIAGSNPAFSVSDTTLSIVGGGSGIVTITYTPQATGVDTGLISFVTNDSGFTESGIPVSGTGFVADRAPVITSIKDIPADQGLQVRVTWFRSTYDSPGDSLHVAFYDVWRKVEDSESAWDFIASVPAVGLSEYGLVAPTLVDSTAFTGIQWSVFKVSARFAELVEPAFSSPDSGYSTNDLNPSTVTGAYASPAAALPMLHWDQCHDTDFDHYDVYTSDQPTGSLAGMSLLRSTTALSCVDSSYVPGTNRYYRVAAVDRAGNTGTPSDQVSFLTTGVPSGGAVPLSFGLEQNFPNPFNPTSEIRYQVSDSRHVKLAVYDLLGREVAVLVNETKAPGSYQTTFNASGLASGVYLSRMTAGDFVQTRRMILTK